MKFYSLYDPTFRGSDLKCDDPSLTQQQFADDADINVMMARFGVTGQMPAPLRLPSYGDFSSANDFRSAMELVSDARNEFMSLPADIRARFGNDPHMLIEFMSDPSNHAEAHKMGLTLSSGGDGGKPPMNNSEGGSVPA